MSGDAVFHLERDFRPESEPLISTAFDQDKSFARPSEFAGLGTGSPRPETVHDQHDSHRLLTWLPKWINGASVVLATFGAAWISNIYLTHDHIAQDALPNLVAILALFSISAPSIYVLDQPRVSIYRQLQGILPAVIFAGLVLAGALWWLNWPAPVVLQAAGIWMTAVTMALIAASQLYAYALSRPFIRQRFTRKIAIIGYDAHAFRIAERIASSAFQGVSVEGVFADVPTQPDQLATNGSLGDLIHLSQEKRGLDAIIIALPPARGHENEIPNLTWRLRGVPADVYVMPYLIHGPDSVLPMQSIGSIPFMVLQRKPLDDRQTICKRIFDVVVSLFALVLFLPILTIAATAIMLDSRGPVIFRQPRCGFNNHQFLVFKFRTMYAETSDIKSFRQTSRNDPRVTRVGKWMRKFSIDELPQLLNVLRGEMSLVGPRPHAPQTRVDGELLDDVVVEYVMRYRVKPGITGWAQVNGARGELVKREDLRRRVAYDLEYIQHWSIIFDVKIMILTAVREIFSKNAF